MSKIAPQPKALLPVDIVSVNDSIFIHLVDPERLDLSRGFLKWSLPDEQPIDQFMLLQDWVKSHACDIDRQNFANTCGIFHVARCGSTLLTQNLKATGRCIVLSEPKFLGRLLHKIGQSLGHELYIQSLRATIAIWQDWTVGQNKRLVIKFSSLAHRKLEDILENLTASKFLFLFREPVAVLESLTRHSPGFVANKKIRSGDEELPEFAGHSGDEPVLYAAKSYCSALDSFTDFADPRLASTDYADLETQFSAILEHFAIKTNDSNIRWNAEKYAKWKNEAQINYQPVAPQLINEFESKEAELIAIAQQYYERYAEYSGNGGLPQ